MILMIMNPYDYNAYIYTYIPSVEKIDRLLVIT